MNTSKELFSKAAKYIPGGVNSPVRAFRSVGGEPLFIKKASGSKIWDVEDNEYIDYVGTWGPAILGHAHPAVIEAIKKAADSGTSFGAPTTLETELAEMVIAAVPSIEKVRMVNSGTEATMSALRLARGFTGRDGIIKFSGCYHGHGDSLLVNAGSGALTLGVPSSPGVPADLAKHTITSEYNDLDMLRSIFAEKGSHIACVIIEPVPGNMGVLCPEKGFLERVLSLCEKYGALLIFDEVMSGFRVAYGGAQQRYSIKPHLTCLGKIIGGGLPVGAYGGRADIMDKLAPLGPVYQAGTLSGNPLAMTAGIETLKILKQPGTYERLEELSAKLGDGLDKAATDAGIEHCSVRVGAMLSMFFTHQKVNSFKTAVTSDTALFSRYFSGMLKKGIYLAPSQFEAGFVSLAHSEDDISKTISAAEEVFASIA